MQFQNRNRSGALISGGYVYHFTHLIFDVAALIMAWQLTLELRLLLNPYMALTLSRARMEAVAPRLIWLLMLWILAALWLRTYRDPADFSIVAGLLRVSESAMVVSALAIVLTFFSRRLGADLSRSFVLLFAPVSFLSLVASFYLSIVASREFRRRWPAPKRVAVLGSGPMAHDLAETIRDAERHHVSVCGLILPESFGNSALGSMAYASSGGVMSATLPVLGTTRELAEVINRESLDRIIVAGDSLSEPEYEHCGRVTRRMGVTVSRPLPSTGSDVLVKHEVRYGLHFIDLQAAPFTHWQDVLKRVTDVAVSLTAITMLLPILATLACLIRLTSEGPIFYRSRRVGKGGRHFTFWKFRSMYTNGPSRRELAAHNETSGHLFKIRRDPRVTPVGRILRRFSLDELPQLFNVLAGEMSLVGPRPLPVEDLNPDGMSTSFAKWAEERSFVRPGITGLWQIRGRSELSFAQMVELDLEYIRKWSFGLDLSILMQTPAAVFTGKGAY